MTTEFALVRKVFLRHFLARNECNRRIEVEQVTGAVFLVRKSGVSSLNGFDEEC